MSEIIFKAVADKQAPLKLVNTFMPIVNEVKMHFNDEGIRVRAVDPANVAMADVTLSADAFESYDSPGGVTMGVNLEAFNDRLSVGGGSDLVELALDMETRKLDVNVGNVKQTMGLIDPGSVRQEPDLPGLDLPNTLVVSGADIQNTVSAVGMVSDHVRLKAEDGEACAIGEGDIDETVVTFGEDQTMDGTDITEDVESLYSHEYIKQLAEPIPGTAEVEMTFGDEFPTHLNWTALEGDLDVTQMLAPRIESD